MAEWSKAVKEILNVYEMALGQKINLDKNAVVFSKNASNIVKGIVYVELGGGGD